MDQTADDSAMKNGKQLSKQSRHEFEMLVQPMNDKSKELITVFERITDAFVAFDWNWNYAYLNKKAAEIIGRRPEELIGKNIWKEFPEKQEHVFYKKFFEAIREQKTIQVEGYCAPVNSWLHAKLYPSPEGLSVYVQDISERKKIELELNETHEKYKQIVDTAQEGIWMIDENNRTIFVNQKMCSILGYTAEEMMGKENFYFMDGEGKKQASVTIDRRKKGMVENFDMRYISKSGKEIWASVSANPILDEHGTYKGALAMISDITEKIKLQQQLAKEHANRQKEMISVETKAEENERNKIGQELHDNVNQLLAASNLYLGRALAQDDNKKFIKKSSGIILEAIEEIRKLSKSLVGPTKVESIGLVAAIKDLIFDFSAIKNLKIVFNHKAFSEDNTDASLKIVIYRIIQEQLNNILKHAEASEAAINIKAQKEGLALIIKDNGRGFDTSGQRMGIGLLNIKNRAEIYGGQVDIISSPGQGCEMKIIFNQVG